MEIADINCRYLQKLDNAASQWVVQSEPQLMLELMDQLQQESFLEGCKFSIEVLQDNFKEIIERKS